MRLQRKGRPKQKDFGLPPSSKKKILKIFWNNRILPTDMYHSEIILASMWENKLETKKERREIEHLEFAVVPMTQEVRDLN